MKKLLLSIIIILSIFMLFSCQVATDNDTDKKALDLDNIQEKNNNPEAEIINAGVENDAENNAENQDAQADKEKDIDMVANDDEILSDDATNENNPKFILKAIVKKVENDRIEAEVIESDYAFGIYWILTGSTTVYYNQNGSVVTRQSIKVGDTVEITYSGQTMLSYPPQVVAYQIRLAN